MPDTGPLPFVAFCPVVRFGRANINNTQVSVDAITGAYLAGEDIPTICREYDLTRADVLTACWYAAVHGDQTGWRPWAEEYVRALWSRVPAGEIPDPPTPDDEPSTRDPWAALARRQRQNRLALRVILAGWILAAVLITAGIVMSTLGDQP